MRKHKYHSQILWLVIIVSLAGLFFSPTEELINQLKVNLPWVATGILISEIVLTTGFLMMLYIATPAFVRSLSKNLKSAVTGLFHLKEEVDEFDWAHVANKCNNSRFFWFGFWLSVVGACGDGVVLIVGIGRTMPVASWGLMILPFWDLGLTYVIRKAIHTGVTKTPHTPKHTEPLP